MAITTTPSHKERSATTSIDTQGSERHFLFQNVIKVVAHFTVASVLFAIALTYYGKNQQKGRVYEQDHNVKQEASSLQLTDTAATAAVSNTAIKLEQDIDSKSKLNHGSEPQKKTGDSKNPPVELTTIYNKHPYTASFNSVPEHHNTSTHAKTVTPPAYYSYRPTQTPAAKPPQPNERDATKMARFTATKVNETSVHHKVATADCSAILTKLSLGNALNPQEHNVLMHSCK